MACSLVLVLVVVTASLESGRPIKTSTENNVTQASLLLHCCRRSPDIQFRNNTVSSDRERSDTAVNSLLFLFLFFPRESGSYWDCDASLWRKGESLISYFSFITWTIYIVLLVLAIIWLRLSVGQGHDAAGLPRPVNLNREHIAVRLTRTRLCFYLCIFHFLGFVMTAIPYRMIQCSTLFC